METEGPISTLWGSSGALAQRLKAWKPHMQNGRLASQEKVPMWLSDAMVLVFLILSCCLI